MTTIDRRTFLRRTGVATGALAAAGPLGALSARAMAGEARFAVGHGPLSAKTDARGNTLFLPEGFDFVTVQQQGDPMRDGSPTPGIFDGMGAYPPRSGERGTVLIRNHENRERAGEQRVVVPPALEYNAQAAGGNTKLVVDPRAILRKEPPYVLDCFPILGGTSTNCAGGETPWGTWVTCEEVVKRTANGTKHGYAFEIDAAADDAVKAIPIPSCGRFAHEAAAWVDGALYLTEDQSLSTHSAGSSGPAEQLGAVLYRFVPDQRPGRNRPLHTVSGRLEALKVVGEPKANLDVGRSPGDTFTVEWVPVPEPDHDDDTNANRLRIPGRTPTRVQAIDNGAAFFDRQEGCWVGGGKLYFDCTSGGPVNGGQVWELDPSRNRLTLIYQSADLAVLDGPDNVVIVPGNGDILLQEDAGGDQYVRGLTKDGRIYDLVKSGSNDSEFCGGCFDPNGQILYVNNQGERGSLPNGPDGGRAITYAIFGPFKARDGRSA